MSMSTYIKGIPSKEKLDAAERIIEDCKIAGVEYPDAVSYTHLTLPTIGG